MAETADIAKLIVPLQERFRDPVEDACLTAVFNSMLIVNAGQVGAGLEAVGESWIKDPELNNTAVSYRDIKSEKMAQAIVGIRLPGIQFGGEEGTNTPGHPTDNIYLDHIGYDGLDGSRPDAVGAPVSTVICAAYNRDGSVQGAAIGEPSTGRIFSAFGPDNPVEGRRVIAVPIGNRLLGVNTHFKHNVQPWQGTLGRAPGDNGQVFIDNNLSFSRDGHTALTNEQIAALRAQLQPPGIGEMGQGSNGAHQLYVVSGRNMAAVAITSARGVQEDTSAGTFLRQRQAEVAGLDPDRVVRRLASVNGMISTWPLPESPAYNLAVVANIPANLDRVIEIFGHITR